MQLSRLKISQKLQDKLISYLDETISFKYKNILPEMAVLATEEFYLRTSSEQLNMIVIKRVDPDLFVDIIGGGGGTGLLSIDWGSEKSFVRKTARAIEDFCNNNGESVQAVEME